MQKLKTLELCRCSDLLNNFPVQLELRQLKRLVVYICRLESASSPFLTWMTNQLLSLEELTLWRMKKNETNFILDHFFTTDVICFQESLKYLGMNECNLDGEMFQTLFSGGIHSKFPKLLSIDLYGKKIENIKPVVDKFKNNNNRAVSKSLQVLNLISNLIMDKMKTEPIEKAAMLSLLDSCNTIYCLGSSTHWYGSDIEYALRINHAGRSIVESGGSNGRSPPLSLWPTILERAYKKSGHICGAWSSKRDKHDATGLYYLVREVGPALISRRTAFSGIGNDDDGGDSDDNDGRRKITSKRKAIEIETMASALSTAATATAEVAPSVAGGNIQR